MWLFSSRGADINWEGPDDKSPLHVAASAGNRAVTQLLLGYGANVRAKDNNLYVFVLHFNTFWHSKNKIKWNFSSVTQQPCSKLLVMTVSNILHKYRDQTKRAEFDNTGHTLLFTCFSHHVFFIRTYLFVLMVHTLFNNWFMF